MRHKKAGRQFGRDTSSRRAMLRNLAANLITHERIETTDAKAKELRRIAERLITKAVRIGKAANTPNADLQPGDKAKRLHVSRQLGSYVPRWGVTREGRLVFARAPADEEEHRDHREQADRHGGEVALRVVLARDGVVLERGEGGPGAVVRRVELDGLRERVLVGRAALGEQHAVEVGDLRLDLLRVLGLRRQAQGLAEHGEGVLAV